MIILLQDKQSASDSAVTGKTLNVEPKQVLFYLNIMIGSNYYSYMHGILLAVCMTDIIFIFISL